MQSPLPPYRSITTSPRQRAPTARFSEAPADAFQLLPEALKAGEAEDALYDAEIREVEAWWQTERFAGIKRPYSAADVVSKRGTVQQQYPSSLMAQKLFRLLQERGAAGAPIHTRPSCHVC